MNIAWRHRFSAPTGHVSGTHRPSAFTPDGTSLVDAANTVQVWQLNLPPLLTSPQSQIAHILQAQA